MSFVFEKPHQSGFSISYKQKKGFFMIEYKKGDLFKSDAEAIVNAVNCVGVMGGGIALEFKKRFPNNFRFYKDACKRKEITPGKMFIYFMRTSFRPKYIINFPTKKHWRDKSKIEDVRTGLDDLVCVIKNCNISSIAVPALGCGLGKLNWDEVRSCMEAAFAQLPDVKITVFEPGKI